jgi:hypothetical protein
VGLVLCIIGLIQMQNSPQLYTTNKMIPLIGIVIALLDFLFLGIAIASGAFHQVFRNFGR